MEIFEKIIEEQIVDAIEWWRGDLEIPLRLSPEGLKAILADSKSFLVSIQERIETERLITTVEPDPKVVLNLNPDGGLVVNINGVRLWRFKPKQEIAYVEGQ